MFDLITQQDYSEQPEPTPRNIENLGLEFFEWAEKHWAFERIVSKGLGDTNGESCPYPLYKEYFINKINDLVDEKIKYEILQGSNK